MSRYLDLLKNYAKYIGLEPVEALLDNQELLIGEVVVGLVPDDNENPSSLTFFTSLGKPAPTVSKEKLFLNRPDFYRQFVASEKYCRS